MNKHSLAAVLPLLLATNLAFSNDGCNLADIDPIALDKDKNAELSREETQGTTLAWAFDQVDTNGDGIISQPEFGARCASYQNAAGSNVSKAEAEPREPTAAEKAAAKKAERQKKRAAGKVDSRVDKETDKAVDSAIDKGLDSLFGN